jgi:hypothetical protein
MLYTPVGREVQLAGYESLSTELSPHSSITLWRMSIDSAASMVAERGFDKRHNNTDLQGGRGHLNLTKALMKSRELQDDWQLRDET